MKIFKAAKAALSSKISNTGGGKQNDASGAGPQQPESRAQFSVPRQKTKALAGQISSSIPLPPQVAGISSLFGTSSLSSSLPSATQSVQHKEAASGPTGGYNERPMTTSVRHTKQGGGHNVNDGQSVSTHEGQKVNEAATAFLSLRLADRSSVPTSNITRAVSVEGIAEGNVIFCRWCDRCKEGIKYSSNSLDSLICIQCNFWVCRNCRYVHTTLHSQRIQVELRQWVASSTDFDPVYTCSKCSQPALARLQCKSSDCSHSLCLACFQKSVFLYKFLQEHFEKNPMHNEFLAIYPEDWSVSRAWEQNPCQCLIKNTEDSSAAVSITHCEMCHIPVNIESSVYWCRHCHEIWGETQWICEQCFQKKAKDHSLQNKDHYFVKMLIIENSTILDAQKERFYCPACKKWLSEADYISHKHVNDSLSDKLSTQRDPDIYWVLSPRGKDWQRINLYRNCDKVRLARGSVQYADEIAEKGGLSKCVQCQFRLAYNTSVTICVRGGCNHFIYCASCTAGTSPGRKIIHRHKESTYTVMLHRRVQLPVAKITCFKCRRDYSKTLFTGIYCGHCKQFGVCWLCIAAAAKGGTNELPPGLPHSSTPNSTNSIASGLKDPVKALTVGACPVNRWVLIFEFH